jgi:hypothetical protein
MKLIRKKTALQKLLVQPPVEESVLYVIKLPGCVEQSIDGRKLLNAEVYIFRQ